jgi:spore maturation protein SpmA
MVLNYIWVGFFLVAMVAAIVQCIFFQDFGVFERIVNGTFAMAKMSVIDIALPLSGTMILWLGIMNIGERAGAIRFLSRIIGPFFAKLFPGIPEDHPVNGQLVMNFSANMLGLDNAATPLGLKAMAGLQSLNTKKETASDAQIMFLALNTSGLTLIPVTIMTQRFVMGAKDPTDVFIPLLLSTFASTLIAIIYVGIRQHLNLLNRVVLGWLGGIMLFIGILIAVFSQMDQQTMIFWSKVVSNVLLFTIIVTFIVGALIKRVNVYEAFIGGAKTGFETSVKVMPYLVGMLVAIGVLRDSGALDFVLKGVRFCFSFLPNTDFVDSLPTALMKPLSGSGAKAMMVETMQKFGADSFPGRLSCLFQGAADTTFYIIALYFGSVGIKRTRYAVTAGLVADVGGAIAAILIGYAFFH